MDASELDEKTLASKLEDLKFISRVATRLRASERHTRQWRKDAREDYDFVAGTQYTPEDAAALKDNMMPCITFNRSDVYVKAVVGIEALNKKEIKYIARSPGAEQSGSSDLMSSAADYVNEDALADVHHSDAFRDLVICGMGWSLTRMDYTRNPQGELAIERQSPLMAYWDPRATQRNLSDSRWRAIVTKMSSEEVRERWPDKAEDISSVTLMEPSSEVPVPVDAEDRADFFEQRASPFSDDDDVWVAQYQWVELNDVYPIQSPQGVQYLPAKDYKALKEVATKQAPEVLAILNVKPIKQRKYYQAFVAGHTILERVQLSCDEFSLCVMTGNKDENNNVWYGLLRALKSPQEYLNKLYSSILHIINSQAKGGIIAETNAFEDPSLAEKDWARPDRIIYAKQGALAQGRIMPKPIGAYPQGMDRLMEFAMQMFSHVSGANIELLGLAEKAQPGVLEAQRKQAGMTILSWAFDAYAAYKRAHGKVLAKYIQKYIADERLIRIAGDQGYQFLPLMKNQLATEYDYIIDEAVNSPDEKGRTFGVLMQLLPTLYKDGGMPPSMYDYLPLPASLAQELKQQAQGDPKMAQMAEMLQQLQMMLQQAEVQKVQAEAGKTQAEVAKTEAETQLKLAETEKTQVEAKTEVIKAVV